MTNTIKHSEDTAKLAQTVRDDLIKICEKLVAAGVCPTDATGILIDEAIGFHTHLHVGLATENLIPDAELPYQSCDNNVVSIH